MPGTETYRFDDSDLRGEQAHNGRTFSARGFRADNQSRDFGLRFTLFDRKIFGSFTYYDTKQLNQVRNSLSEIINDFDDVWDTIENAYATLSPATLAAARLPATPPTRPTDDATAVYSRNTSEDNGNPGAIFADTLDSKSKGLELELTANPTPNWRLSWSVSQHLSTVSAARKTAIGYYTTHLPTWQHYVDSAGTIVAPLSTVYIQADMRGLRLADMLKAIANGFDETNAEVGGQRYGIRIPNAQNQTLPILFLLWTPHFRGTMYRSAWASPSADCGGKGLAMRSTGL
jgi:hypothetical protein